MNQDSISSAPAAILPGRRGSGTQVAVPLSVRNWSVSVAREDRTRNVAMWLFLVLLFRTTIAAPIRAFVPILWYIPDFLMLAAFAVLFTYGLRYSVLKTISPVSLLAVLIVYALLNNSFVAVALQTRQIGYVLLACLVGMGVRSNSQTVSRAIVILGAVAIVGIYWDYFFRVPWAGAVFSGALQPAEVAREWWSAAGERRLSGLGIASTETSAIIAVGCITACSHIRNRLLGVLYCILAVHTLLLTTQKATAGWVIVLVAVYYLPTLFSRRGGRPNALPLLILKTLAITGLVGCVLVPLMMYQVRLSDLFGVAAPTLDQRTAEVWPTIIPMLLSFPQFLLGYGMGAVGGTATDARLFLCDNMFLYLALNFGVPIALAIFLTGGFALWKAPLRSDRDSYALAVAALLILNGITANVLGAGGVNGTYLGFAIGLLLRPKPRGGSRGTGTRATRASAAMA